MKEGDLVWVPDVLPHQKEMLPGKVVKTKWKVNGEWVTVEVTYKDLAGKEHTTTLKPMRPEKLSRRSI
jgi:hypothetical protein